MTKITILNNKNCQIVSEDESLIKKIRNKLSFKPTGVEYTPAFQNGWSGITYLLSKKNVFPLGLLDCVKSFLEKQNEAVEIIDNRAPIEVNVPIDISSVLIKNNIVPREYQLKVLEAAQNNRKGIIRACTGSGKTLCAAMITAEVNKPTIIYVIGLDLLNQFHELFSKIFNEPIGIIGNGVCDIKRINIASIWTVGKALNLKSSFIEQEDNEDEEYNPSNAEKILACLKVTKLHILDECHLVVCDTVQSIYKNIDPERIYGLSGTPYRDDNTDLLITGMLGEKIVNISASELIDKGFLAQPIIKFVNVPPCRTGKSNYHTVYKDYVVESEIRNNIIIENTKFLLDKGYQTLVLFKYINHGDRLYDLFQEREIKCALLSGNDSLENRLEVKRQLLNKEIDLVLASSIFDIGIDISSLSGLILAGGGKSSIRTLQRIGRVIRSFPGKKYAAIIDFVDNVKFLKNHSKIRYNIYKSEDGFKVSIPKGVKL